jgi:hypothetical protein
MGRLFGDFRHPDGVAGGVEAVQRGGPAVLLVAQNQQQMAHG